MTYKAALKLCKRVGTNRATGDELRAMYANMLAFQHGGSAEQYYAGIPGGTDQEIAEFARGLMRDRALAWDVLVGDKPCKS